MIDIGPTFKIVKNLLNGSQDFLARVFSTFSDVQDHAISQNNLFENDLGFLETREVISCIQSQE